MTTNQPTQCSRCSENLTEEEAEYQLEPYGLFCFECRDHVDINGDELPSEPKSEPAKKEAPNLHPSCSCGHPVALSDPSRFNIKWRSWQEGDIESVTYTCPACGESDYLDPERLCAAIFEAIQTLNPGLPAALRFAPLDALLDIYYGLVQILNYEKS